MKKYLLVILVLGGLMAFSVSIASANGGPHGGYTATTDACAGCHRAHTAQGPRLLVEADTNTLCLSCHGAAGTGADTNVEDGIFLSTRSASTFGEANTVDNADLLAGGFVNQGGAAVTSDHFQTGSSNAWGNAVNRGATAAITDVSFTCASCHDPHGSANYRILKTTVNGNAVTVADPAAAQGDYDDENWGAGMSNICAACHSDYHKTAAGQGSTLDGTSYTHRVDMNFAYGANNNPETVGMGGLTLPLAESGVNDMVVCNTCHFSHGSSAAMAGFADGGPTGSGTIPGNTTAANSSLLRLDNRGVCEVCHQK